MSDALQTRWQVVTHPGALPGECFLCAGDSTTREWFIDTGRQMEFHGAVYICNECLLEMAAMVGCASQVETTALVEAHMLLEQKVFGLETELAGMYEMERAIDVFIRARSSRSYLRPDGSHAGLDAAGRNVSDADNSGLTEDRPSDGEAPVGTGAGAPSESGDGQGVDELRSTSGQDGDNFKLQL